MPENLIHTSVKATKEEKYLNLLPQLECLMRDESNLIANLANTSAALKETFNFLWVGFYLIELESNELVLGPFQGPIACTRIRFGKGVCGTCWKNESCMIVPDVDKFPGHIACSSLSKSEIVVPLFDKMNTIIGVLDVDSEHLDYFNEIDKIYLEKICELFYKK